MGERSKRSILLFLYFSITAISSALGGSGDKWDDQALRGAGMPPLSYEVKPALGEGSLFERALLTIPYQDDKDTNKLLILGQYGRIWSVPADKEEAAAVAADDHLVARLQYPLDQEPLSDSTSNQSRRIGLLGGVFDRDWPKRPYLYLGLNQKHDLGASNYIVRYSVASHSPFQLSGDPEILFQWQSDGHNGCDLHWGPEDGLLYFSAGDGSVPGDPQNVGQTVSEVHGAVLRIDVHGQPDLGKAYAVPRDNPFVGMPQVVPEIWCYGLRNPWRMCFHPTTHELWIGDNGDELWEMVHRVAKGTNSGWSVFEGRHPFRPSNKLGGPTLVHTPPLIEHPHSEMRSIIGGIFYRGTQCPDLVDHYLYGCYMTRDVWAVAYNASTDQLGKPFRIARASGQLTSIREDHHREVILTSLEGHVEALHRREQTIPPRPWPKTLRETGLFDDVATQTPAAGVYEYLINAQGWADGATRRRFIAIPNTQRPLSNDSGVRLYKSLTIHPGGALVQTLYLKEKPIETQVLYNSGTWTGYTYKWNRTGTQASLVVAEGETVDGVAGTDQHWRYSSRGECMVCHTQRSLYGLAFTTPQLNRIGVNGENQLDHWVSLGLLRNSRILKQRREDMIADPYEPESGTLEQRVRAYLDVNCAYCHRETGLGGRATFELMHHLTLEQTGIVGELPKVGILGDPEGKIIAPGRPELSELLARMNRRGAGQMPLFGSLQVDAQGVALLKEWIESLDAEESADE